MAETARLDELVLEWGTHARPDEGMCVMEAVSVAAGEPFGDHPECVSSVAAAFVRRWNDDLGDVERQILRPYVSRLAGPETPGYEEARAWLATDWLVREWLPELLRLAGLGDRADDLEPLPPLTGSTEAARAEAALSGAGAAAAAAAEPIWAGARDEVPDSAVVAARAATWGAAWQAARRAGWAAAGSAAWAAVDGRDGTPWTEVGDTARIVAWDAARAAAWGSARDAALAAPKDAAGDAAWTAAWDAAQARLQPTVGRLQQSALVLLDRMLELGTPAT